MSRHEDKIDTGNQQVDSGKFLTPFQRKLLQKSLQTDLTESYRQRIHIMLLADEGKTQALICRNLGCCPATARHWMHIARSGMAHQWQDCPIGRRKSINDQYLERLKELVTSSPCDFGYSFRQWSATWLSRHLAKEFDIEVTPQHISRLLKQVGLSTRPKPERTQVHVLDGASGSQIMIHDLKSAPLSDSAEFLPINFPTSLSNSNVHETKSI
ncbi:hypothetical protein RIVM261_033040 [Rivularia sp. IAM M-261]|nr:hypothetical protein RIVM261_033040 [Rivularia sp. IAM M-261]